MIVKKIKNSLAFRLPILYKLILKLHHNKFETLNSKDSLDFSLVILCGFKQFDMLQECLKSIYHSFDSLPHINLFTDKTLSKEHCSKHLNWFPRNHLSITNFSECIEYHSNNQNQLIKKFAVNNPMGLKLAAILQILDKGMPVLYCDTDVLWFKDPSSNLKLLLENDNIEMALSEDYQPAYDNNLISKGSLTELKSKPFFCAGILLIKKLSKHNKDNLNKLLSIVIDNSNHFSEQTIFAYFNKISGNYSLNKSQFSIILDDQFQIKPSLYVNVIARHYVGAVRHQFWRDAFFRNFKRLSILR